MLQAPALEVLSQAPAGSTGPPLLFVHGAWHGAWCWTDFLDYFARQGYAAHALSLRGHGASHGRERLRWTRLSEYVSDVARVVRELDLPRPPIVVGHSLGGFVVQHYLAQGHPASGAVFVASVPPTIGAWPAVVRAIRRHPLAFLRINLTLSVYPLVETEERAHDMLFSERSPRGLVRQYFPLLQDESYLGFLGLLLTPPNSAAVRRRGLPVLAVGGDADRLFSPGDARRVARTYAGEVEVFAGVGHDMMLDVGWERVAARILTWLNRLPTT